MLLMRPAMGDEGSSDLIELGAKEMASSIATDTPSKKDRMVREMRFKRLVLKALMTDCAYELAATDKFQIDRSSLGCFATMTCKGTKAGSLKEISIRCEVPAQSECPKDPVDCGAGRFRELLVGNRGSISNEDLKFNTKNTEDLFRRTLNKIDQIDSSRSADQSSSGGQR